MAKGENLEKPKKKGGMVIVIGMGAKPKESMKKSFGRGSDDAKLANRAKTLRRFKSGRNNIDDILDKRKIDPDEFHGEFLRRNNMSFEDYLESDRSDADIQGLIDELAEKRFGAAKKTAIEGQQRREGRAKQLRESLLNTSKFRGMLRNKGIDENAWLRAVNKIPMTQMNDNTFNELIDKLKTRDGGGGQRNRGSSRDTPRDTPRDTSVGAGLDALADRVVEDHEDYQQRRGRGLDADAQDRMAEDEKGGRRRIKVFDRKHGGAHGGPRDAEIIDELPQDSEEEARALRFYQRLFSHHPDPIRSALQQLGRGTVRDQNRQDFEDELREGLTPDPTPSTVFTKPNAPPGFRAGSPDEDEDPNVRFDAASIGATTPKKDTANPRELNDPRSTRAGQGEERTIRPFQMQTSFDSTNVMDAAWALLKGNRDMRDAKGRTINHPAAMVYDNLAAQVGQDIRSRPSHDAEGRTYYPSVSERLDAMRDTTPVERAIQERRNNPGEPRNIQRLNRAMRSVGMNRDRLNRFREEAREQTRDTMEFGNEDDSPSPNYGIQRQREADTDVKMKEGNIMDQV